MTYFFITKIERKYSNTLRKYTLKGVPSKKPKKPKKT